MHSNRSVRFLICALPTVGLLLGGATPASAQAAGDASRRFRESLPAGTRVRVAVRAAGRAQGRVVEVSDSTLQLDGAAGALVPLAAIDSLWQWRRSWATGARRGAVAGSVAGVVAGLLFSAVYCKIDCGAAQSVAVFAGVATLGAAAGAATGALVGLPIRHWSRLHP